MTTFMEFVVAAIPIGVVVALLRLADRIQRKREHRLARQIELTNAIHREMGAAAAPTVERRGGGGWLVRMSVPLDRPAVVAAILRVTHQVLGSPERADTLQIVLTPRPASPAVARALRPVPHRPATSATSVAAATR